MRGGGSGATPRRQMLEGAGMPWWGGDGETSSPTGSSSTRLLQVWWHVLASGPQRRLLAAERMQGQVTVGSAQHLGAGQAHSAALLCWGV